MSVTTDTDAQRIIDRRAAAEARVRRFEQHEASTDARVAFHLAHARTELAFGMLSVAERDLDEVARIISQRREE